jgi:hypothetical protein
MLARMATKQPQCAGCSRPAAGGAGGIWCSQCAATVKPFTVHLTADQRKLIDALAVVRGVTAEEVLRQGVHTLGTRRKIARPTPAELAEVDRLRAGGKLKSK